MPRPIAEVTCRSGRSYAKLMGRGMPRPYNTCDSEQEVLAAAGEVTENQWVAACRDRTTSATQSKKYLPQRKKLRKLMGRGMPRPYNTCDSEQKLLAAAEEVTQNQWVAACRDRTTSATQSRSTCRSGRSYAKPMGRGMPRPYNTCNS